MVERSSSGKDSQGYYTDEPRILKFDSRVIRPKVSKTLGEHEVLGQYIPLIYHYNMLQDEDRVGAFLQAIELLVRPGMRVVELGAGTGILSSFAARRGATVRAIERNPELVQCSRRFLAENGLADRVRVIQADAANWIPEEPVDLVICEMLHVGLLREKQAQVISAFKQNYISKFGKQLPIFVPEVSILMCQPIEQDFRFAGYHAPLPMFQAPVQAQPRTQEIAALQSYQMVHYDQQIETKYNCQMNFQAAVSGQVNAMRMVTQNVLTIDTANQQAITWANQCLVLPMKSPVYVNAGDKLSMSINYEAGQPIESVNFKFGFASQRSSAAA